MGSNNKNDKKLTNGAILIVSKVLKHVMSSAAEADIGAVFINAKEGAVLRTPLEELGHKQPPTPMDTDNTTATGYSNGTIKQKRTKAMDMRFYRIKYRVKKDQFKIYWGPGFQNLSIFDISTVSIMLLYILYLLLDICTALIFEVSRCSIKWKTRFLTRIVVLLYALYIVQ
jgi:hypothetical protein